MINERFTCKTIHKGITTIFGIVVMLLLFSTSCSGDDKEVVEVTFDPETTYTMKTTDVLSLISDSGITRYRVIAQEWYMFDKAQDPFSYFPEGFYVERFDSTFQVEGSVKADTCYNWNKRQFWKLIGNVEVQNLAGEYFETSLLYFDQKEEKFYSDQFIRIEQKDRIITGIGFESNQDMSKYRIFNSAGEFDVTDTSPPPDSTQTQTVQTAPLLPILIPEAQPDSIAVDVDVSASEPELEPKLESDQTE